MATTTNYELGDLVFAKMDNYPHWPAKIVGVIPGRITKYKVYFYGSRDTSPLPLSHRSICLYTEETKAKYGNEKVQRRGGIKFIKGLAEIEDTDREDSETEDTTELKPELNVLPVKLHEPVHGNVLKTRRKSVTSTSRDLDLSHIPKYKDLGAPDLLITFHFPLIGRPSVLVDNKIHVKLHRSVLVSLSPVFKGWMTTDGGPFMEQSIDGSDEDFVTFLTYLYTQELTPDILVPIFGFVLKFQLALPMNSLMAALSPRNTLELLDRFPMHHSAKFYRTYIMDSINGMVDKVVASTYFQELSHPTLEEVSALLLGKVPEDTFWEALYGWAKAECLRLNLQSYTIRDLQNVVPSIIKEVVGGRGMLRCFSKMLEEENEEDKENIPPSLKRKRGNGPKPEKRGAKIPLYIEGFSTTETFDIAANGQVGDLLSLISKRVGIPEANMRIIHEDVELEPGKTLGFYKVRSESRIYVRLYIGNSTKFDTLAIATCTPRS